MQPDKQGFFKDTQQLAEEYIRERLLLLKLETAEKSARLSSVVFTSVIIGVFAIIILLLLSALGCYFLKEITGSWYYGISIITFIYIIILTILVMLRKTVLHKHVTNFVIRLFFEKTEEIEA